MDERWLMEPIAGDSLLALLNCVVFLACLADLSQTPTVKNLFAMLAWCASTTFWLEKCVIPL